MRKFLAVLMAAFMLTAALAVLPASAAVTTSTKDGTVIGNADIDLVVTEVLADTMSNHVDMANSDAFQYIEVYNRGDEDIYLYNYAIVRALYKEKDKGNAWPAPKKFTQKIVLDPGSIYQHYIDEEVAAIDAYKTTPCANTDAENGKLAPGKTALIWVWNKATHDVMNKNGGLANESAGVVAFRQHYKDHGAEIPADVKIFAAFGVTGVGQSFELNTTNNYMYAVVEDGADSANTFDITTEVAFTQNTAGGFAQNDKVVSMFKFGTALGYASTTQEKGAAYTLADKTPYYNNKKNDNEDTNYFEAGKVDGFKEFACIYFEEDMTPGKLLPVQWADLDPDRAPAAVKGTDANWATKAWTDYLAVVLPDDEITNREEEDLNQDEIDQQRENMGNLGQNKAGEWTFFIGEDGNYYRYKTEGGSKDTAVKITKEEYDTAMAALAELEKGEGLGIWLWVIIGGAAVVVLGAGAAVLIVVLKKKNKNVATDDVAGFVEIIDEDAAPAQAASEEKTEE